MGVGGIIGGEGEVSRWYETPTPNQVPPRWRAFLTLFLGIRLRGQISQKEENHEKRVKIIKSTSQDGCKPQKHEKHENGGKNMKRIVKKTMYS